MYNIRARYAVVEAYSYFWRTYSNWQNLRLVPSLAQVIDCIIIYTAEALHPTVCFPIVLLHVSGEYLPQQRWTLLRRRISIIDSINMGLNCGWLSGRLTVWRTYKCHIYLDSLVKSVLRKFFSTSYLGVYGDARSVCISHFYTVLPQCKVGLNTVEHVVQSCLTVITLAQCLIYGSRLQRFKWETL